MVLLRGIGIAKKGYGLLAKDKTQAIKSVRPGTKFKGQKTVDEIKAEAGKSKLKMVKDKLKQTFQKSDEALAKLKKTMEKNK